jgi:hypothetical protein
MAKDGTMRGGARANAGKKRKALSNKLSEGKPAEVLKPVRLKATKPPDISEFAKEIQEDGTKLCADEIFDEVYEWLEEKGCTELVNRQLLEQYSVTASRWIHCEKMLNQYGYISEHPTTGSPIASPYVSMCQSYLKQANYLWQQIYNIFRTNCEEGYTGKDDDMMEILLRKKKK